MPNPDAPAPPSSQLLLARFCGGDSQAARQIFDRYLLRLLKLVRVRMSPQLQRRIDADDVVQSALRSFFVRAADEAYMLQRSGDLWRLLAAITLSKLRRQVEVHTAGKRAVTQEDGRPIEDAWTNLANSAPGPADEAALLEVLEQALAACTPDERHVLQLRLAGESIADIAQTLGRSQRTVRRLLQASEVQLRRRLQACGER